LIPTQVAGVPTVFLMHHLLSSLPPPT
jgi:hypothetical protein